MTPYNTTFFTTLENVFLVLKAEFGEARALALFRQILERGLRSAYDAAGFQQGSPEDFARVVGRRDAAVGLEVSFPEVFLKKIVYRFHTDPFPRLRGLVTPEKLDATYMEFKVSFLLGSEWTYTTTKHLWKGDSFTNHIIEKIV